MPINNIVLIGAGRVASQLGKVLNQNNKTISQVYSRTPASAARLAATLNSGFVVDLRNLDPGADLYIISVADDAIEEITQQLNFAGKIVVHTSGSVSMEVLRKVSDRCGVFYPLNTFSASGGPDLSTTPICIEANDKETEDVLVALGREFSTDVRLITSDQRAMIHLAAVFACNFTNFMMVNADEILKIAGLKFEILLPLITETISKLRKMNPKDAQTGPSLRNDLKVIEKHLHMLDDDPGKKQIYELVSKQINVFFNSK